MGILFDVSEIFKIALKKEVIYCEKFKRKEN